MKKVISAFLALVFVFLTACGAQASSLTMNELIDKYKREDIAILIDDPAALIDDLLAATENLPNNDFTEWLESEYMDHAYDLDSVLFNLPAEFTATAYNDTYFAGRAVVDMVFGDDLEGSLELAEVLCEYMFSKYGDAEEIKEGELLEREEIDEHEWRRSCIDTGNYECMWKIADNVIVYIDHMILSYSGACVSISCFTYEDIK